MDNLFGLEEGVDRRSWIVAHIEHRIAAQIDVAFLAVDCNGAKYRPLAQKQMPELGLTKAGGIRQNGIKHRLQFAG